MTYEHKLVSELYEPSANQNIPDGASVLDGFWVNEHVYALGKALREVPAFRRCKFSGYPERKNSTVLVYFPEQLYALGSIGYRDYSVGESSRIMYCVSAPGIANLKYRPDSYMYYGKLSKDVPTALRNIKKYFKPYTQQQIGELSGGVFHSGVTATRYGYTGAVRNAFESIKEQISGSGTVYAELKHLLDIGYTFTQPGVGDLVRTAAEAEIEVVGMLSNKLFAYMVTVMDTVVPGRPAQVTVSPAGQFSLSDYSSIISMRVKEQQLNYTLDELPEVPAGKLALLGMVGANEFVEGVGVKINDRIFWITTDHAWEVQCHG